MIQLTATGRDARATPSEPITAGSVGLPVVLDLSSDFDGLAVTVCFEAGEAKADVAYLGDPVTVPLQCLTVVGAVLRIGVYGALPTGTIVIPTVWATVGLVRKGAVPSGVDPSLPEPDWTAQVLAAARDAKETAERIEGEVDEWAEAEAARVRAEDARDSAEAARRSAEQARAGAESIRADAETNRVAAEGIRITNESARTSNELARTTAERGRATAETGRALAETARAEAEQVRATAETARSGAEAARAQAEQQRADAERQRAEAETARATAEQARATAEQGRAAAETARAEAETLRATAEQGRADAEASRAQAWAELETDAEQATEAATEAAAALRPEVDWLRGNQLTKELSGDLLTAADAYAAPPMALTVDGRSTQDGTPTPDAPVEIVSVEQVIAHFDGRNILDLNFVDQYTVTSGGSRFTANGDGTFTVEAIADSGGSKTVGLIKGTGFRHLNINYPIGLTSTVANGAFQLPAGTYTFKSYSSNDATKVYLRIRHGAYNATTDGSNNVTFTTDGTEWCQLFIYVQSFSTLLENGPVTLRAQLEANATATSYQPYSGTNVLLNLTQALRSLPDGTKDTLAMSYLKPSTRDGWAWYLPTLTTYVLEFTKTTGFGQFHATSSGHNRVRLAATGAAAGEGHSVCNRFVYNSSTYNYGVPGDYYISGGYMYCIVPDTITTIEDANAWLAENPITLAYRNSPPTPTVTTLDPIELPVLPAPNATVWSDPTTGLQMEYVRDTGIVIASLEAAFADLATS